ncbi:MAG: hypothetical protein WD512_14820 [Candidatus Paceibacterota bacterium]
MKYRKIIIISVLAVTINLFGIGWLSAQDNSTLSNPNNINLESAISNEPKTQDEANLLIDALIKQSFADSYYTDKSSTGEIKLVIKNKYLFTKQKIDFSTINYHIDKSFIFDRAEYTWRIKKGDKVVLELKDINKSSFFYDFK